MLENVQDEYRITKNSGEKILTSQGYDELEYSISVEITEIVYISGMTLENGNYIAYEYDELGRFTNFELTSDKNGNTGVIEESYTYVDGNGNDTSYIC
jgi:hypothetical protein